MTEPLVVLRYQTFWDETEVAWYEDEIAAAQDDWLVRVSPRRFEQKRRGVPPDVRDLAIELLTCQLAQDPQADLSMFTTHHQVEPGGCIEPNEVRTP